MTERERERELSGTCLLICSPHVSPIKPRQNIARNLNRPIMKIETKIRPTFYKKEKKEKDSSFV